jgi:hypothetical protein
VGFFLVQLVPWHKEMMMRFMSAVGSLLLSGCALGYAQFAAAQACSGFQGTIPSNTLPPDVINGNNCGNNLPFAAICSNSDTLGGGGLDVYQITLGTLDNHNVQFTLTSAVFTPELAVTVPGGACSSSTACAIDQTISGTGTVGPVSFPTNPAPTGPYYIFVGNVADAACGAYSLVFNASAVKLQDFSVN